MKYRVYVDQSKARKDGQMPVALIFEDAGNRTKIATGLMTTEKFAGREFPDSVANSRAKTLALARILMKIDEHLIMETDEPWAKTIGFVKSLLGKDAANTGLLYRKIEEYADGKRAWNTKRGYRQTAAKVKGYDARMTLGKVTKRWLDGFVEWLEKEQGLAVNARAAHVTRVKAVTAWAYDEGVIATLPLARYRIKRETVAINNISVGELRRLRDCRVAPRMEKYRDLFMLSFYLCGINPVDLLGLTAENVRGDRIVYRRSKTGKLYDIPLVAEAREIIDRYGGKEHLLRFMDGRDKYASFAGTWLKNLKAMREEGSEDGPLFPNITLYTARYTFASIGAELEIPRETIALCLGHAWADVTSHYIAYDLKRVDEAVRRIIDYVNGKG